jgi:class 3 adenylate cyclase
MVTAVLSVVAGLELIALVVVATLLIRSRRQVTDLRLQLDTATRPAPRTVAGRAMKAFVGTAVRMRDQGVGGFLASSLEDVTRWATEDRAEIVRLAAPDGTVTVFFSDIEDSTTLNEQLGDTEWVRVLGEHEKVVRSCVDKHEGHVVKSQGDGFMVVFPEPGAGVRAAVALQKALHNGAPRRLRRSSVSVRIGLHVGPAVTRDGDYFGRNVALAARVAAYADGGEILVSDELRTALPGRDEFVLAPKGEVELKGFTGVHALWEVRWQA